MGARTRKNRRTQGNGVGIHAPSIAVFVVAATIFISYLWLCGRCKNLDSRISGMETDLENLNRRVMTEEHKWARTKSPGNIRQYLRQHGLIMDWPDEQHILRIPGSLLVELDRPTDTSAMRLVHRVGEGGE